MLAERGGGTGVLVAGLHSLPIAAQSQQSKVFCHNSTPAEDEQRLGRMTSTTNTLYTAMRKFGESLLMGIPAIGQFKFMI